MYRIEIVENDSKLNLSYEQFDVAKTVLNAISKELVLDNEYYLEQNINVRMYDSDDKLFHYITAYHPGVSLPSSE